MTVAYYPGRPSVQESMPDEGQHRREIARVVNVLMQGHSNAVLQLTLTANAASTTVVDARISLQTAPVPTPLTANAAAEIAAGQMYFTPTKGQVVVTHRNLPATDRTFQLALLG